MIEDRQIVNIPFTGGLDEGTDPKILPDGKFQELNNVRVDKSGKLLTRYGYQQVETWQPGTELGAVASSFYHISAWRDQNLAVAQKGDVYAKIGDNTGAFTPERGGAITSQGRVSAISCPERKVVSRIDTGVDRIDNEFVRIPGEQRGYYVRCFQSGSYAHFLAVDSETDVVVTCASYNCTTGDGEICRIARVGDSKAVGGYVNGGYLRFVYLDCSSSVRFSLGSSVQLVTLNANDGGYLDRQWDISADGSYVYAAVWDSSANASTDPGYIKLYALDGSASVVHSTSFQYKGVKSVIAYVSGTAGETYSYTAYNDYDTALVRCLTVAASAGTDSYRVHVVWGRNTIDSDIDLVSRTDTTYNGIYVFSAVHSDAGFGTEYNNFYAKSQPVERDTIDGPDLNSIALGSVPGSPAFSAVGVECWDHSDEWDWCTTFSADRGGVFSQNILVWGGANYLARGTRENVAPATRPYAVGDGVYMWLETPTESTVETSTAAPGTGSGTLEYALKREKYSALYLTKLTVGADVDPPNEHATYGVSYSSASQHNYQPHARWGHRFANPTLSTEALPRVATPVETTDSLSISYQVPARVLWGSLKDKSDDGIEGFDVAQYSHVDNTANPLAKHISADLGAHYIGGGHISCCAGSVSELGFLQYPETIAGCVAIGTGYLSTGTYYYKATWERVDKAGQRHRSFPGPTLTLTVRNTDYSRAKVTVPVPVLGWSSDVRVVLYRSLVNDPSRFHRVASTDANTGLENGYVTFTDSATDPEIDTSEMIYSIYGGLSDEGFLPFSEEPGDEVPDGASFLVNHGSRLWAASDRRVYYSKLYIADAAPAFFVTDSTFNAFQEFENVVTGLASMGTNLVVFTRRSIYVITGDGPDDTMQNGGFSFNKLPTDAGCIEPRSIVVFRGGCIFQSQRGLELLTTGLEVKQFDGPITDLIKDYPVVTGAVTIDHEGVIKIACQTPPFISRSRKDEDNARSVVLVYNYEVDLWYTETGAGWGTSRIDSLGKWGDRPVLAANVGDSPGLYLQDSAFVYDSTWDPDSTVSEHTNSYIGMSLKTGRIAPWGYFGYGRVWGVGVLGERLTTEDANNGTNVTIEYDWGFSSASASFDVSEVANPGEEVYWLYQPTKQEVPHVTITLTTAADSGYSSSEPESNFALNGIALDVGTHGKMRPVEPQRRSP